MTRHLPKIGLVVALGLLLAYLLFRYAVPYFSPAPQPKPDSLQQTPYDYYILIDADTGETLTYVSTVKVTTGDEYISGDNKRYIVTKVEENRAYLQSFGPADSEDRDKYKDRFQR